MNKKHKRKTKASPQSEGNLALADEISPPIQKPASASMEGHLEKDALAPATGFLSAFGLSVILWGLIILGVYWTW